jgi:hypothetical protein
MCSGWCRHRSDRRAEGDDTFLALTGRRIDVSHFAGQAGICRLTPTGVRRQMAQRRRMVAAVARQPVGRPSSRMPRVCRCLMAKGEHDGPLPEH